MVINFKATSRKVNGQEKAHLDIIQVITIQVVSKMAKNMDLVK
jgi:hypothetical protein